MLEDVPYWCPIVKDLIMDVLLGHVPKCLPLLHLTFWLLSDMYNKDKESLPQSVRQWLG